MASVGWRSIALVASLLVNALVLGVVIGGGMAGLRVAPTEARLQDGHGPRHRMRPRGNVFEPRIVMRAMPREARREMFENMRADREQFFELIERRREASDAALAAIANEPFDADAVRAAFAEIREVSDLMRARGEQALITAFEDLSHDERIALAERLREASRRRRHGRGPEGRGPEGRRGPPPDELDAPLED